MVTVMSLATWAVCSEIAHKIKPLNLDRHVFSDISYGLSLFCGKMENVTLSDTVPQLRKRLLAAQGWRLHAVVYLIFSGSCQWG